MSEDLVQADISLPASSEKVTVPVEQLPESCSCISADAVREIRTLLIAQDVPVAAFIDDHVSNAIAQRNILSNCLRTISAVVDDKTKVQIFAAIEEAFPTRRGLRGMGDAAARAIPDRGSEGQVNFSDEAVSRAGD